MKLRTLWYFLLAFSLLMAFGVVAALAGSTPPVVQRYAVVTNEAELRAAALAATTQPTFTIAVQGRIEIAKPLDIRCERLGFIGTDVTAEIAWSGKYDCNSWKDSPWMCLAFAVPILNTHGVRFSGMERGAIKWQADPDKARFWSITNCSFNKVAVIPCPPKEGRATAENAPYGQCISGHGMYAASIAISGCSFNECNLSAAYRSHSAYLSGMSICVTSSTFFGCGNPFSFGAGTLPKDGQPFRSNIFVAGNLVIGTPEGRAMNPDGVRVPAFLYSFGPLDASTFVGNTIYGEIAYPYVGQPFDSGLNVVGWNNWRYAKITSKDSAGKVWMGADTKVGRYIDFAEWKQFEPTSLWPTGIAP